MDTREYRTHDRSGWNEGVWDDEPDKVQFADERTGLPCLIVRSHNGALCGYVGVPEGHPYFGLYYDDEKVEVSVHGDLTFSAHCSPEDDASTGICHIPGEGEPDHVWWLGFDCAHYSDLMPSLPPSCWFVGATYRDLNYVKQEITSLALQLANVQA